MKLSAWAKEQGVSYRTALNWFHAGKLPVPARQLPTGTILIDPPVREPGVTVAYCRVSSPEQKPDLERQAGRVLTGAGERGLSIDRTITEIGSGPGGRHEKLRKLLADPTVTTIVMEHRDRLASFGVEYLEAALSAQGRRIVVLDDSEVLDDSGVADDLVREMTEMLTTMCARLYDHRSAPRRAAAGVRAAQAEPGEPT
ncbi:IS607 family transposase [Rhodococcus koreensis]|uniref:Putative resolvase n=1 Tax=Rhodococcus koreensis TaxID=99653 RepID=A0A1H4X1Q3_9NOCA|nr:IS607 family transposase [Rhodococcus koreensis]QSE80473.1 IS607 family transposase [Rhodococcus koreensis]SEC99606.1 putative resolvase [Rhodococcus koreensis]